MATPSTGVGRGGPKKTPERLEVIRNVLGLGFKYTLAARAAGIDPKTLWNWRNEDPELSSELETICANFVRGVGLKLSEAVDRGEAWAIKFVLQSRSEEYRPRVIDRGGDEDSTEEKAAIMAYLIEKMGSNVSDGVQARRDRIAANGTNGNGKIKVSFDDKPHTED